MTTSKVGQPGMGHGTRTAGAVQTGGHQVPAVVSPPATRTAARAQRRGWLWGIAGLVAVALGLALYFQPWSQSAPEVSVEIVALAPVTRVLAVNGTIAAAQSIDLRPQVSGTLTDVLVTEGDDVAVGDQLAQIDASAQQAAVRQALASLDAALVAQADAQASYTRAVALGDNIARTALETAERTLASATQEVARMQALFDAAQIQLAEYTIRAPIAGSVVVLDAEAGASVDPTSVLATLADLSRLEVETDVDEAYATQIQPGQRAVLQLTGEATLRDGLVSAVSRQVDEETGALSVTLTFDEAVTAPIGLTVTANIVVETRPDAITVPRAAIVSDAGETGVFVVADGIAARRGVEVIEWPAARLIVVDGLAPGDVVITDATGLADGQAVMMVQP